MSTHIMGFVSDQDPDFQRHKKVFDVCLEAGVSLPKETAAYFGDDHPYDELVDNKLKFDLEKDVHYKVYREDMSEGFEVDISKLPAGVSKIRFYNSY